MGDDFKDFAAIGKALNQSLLHHTWYLTPQLVVLALAIRELESEVKTNILHKLLPCDVPEKKDLFIEKPALDSPIVPMSPVTTL